MRLSVTASLVVLVLLGSVLAAAPVDQTRVRLEVQTEGATIGDHLPMLLVVELPPETAFEPPPIGPSLGEFSVIDGSWSEPEVQEGRTLWSWAGHVAAYSSGALELPSIPIDIDGPEGRYTVSSDPVSVELGSVLSGEDQSGEGEIADLKPPASIRADLGPLFTAMWILGGLLLAAAVLWWLQRRYAGRLAAAGVPEDPFRRTPPHVWVYAELKQLLERRLPEQGQIEPFYNELSRILKRYLSGRFRIELLERTSAEVPEHLEQAGCAVDAVRAIEDLLSEADSVKFAKDRPRADNCRDAVERIYRIVDRTKPLEDSRSVAGAA